MPCNPATEAYSQELARDMLYRQEIKLLQGPITALLAGKRLLGTKPDLDDCAPVEAQSTAYFVDRLRTYANEFREEGNYSHGIYADKAAERLAMLNSLTHVYASAFGRDYRPSPGPHGLSPHMKKALAEGATGADVAFALKVEGALYALGSDWGTSPTALLLWKAAKLLEAVGPGDVQDESTGA